MEEMMRVISSAAVQAFGWGLGFFLAGAIIAIALALVAGLLDIFDGRRKRRPSSPMRSSFDDANEEKEER